MVFSLAACNSANNNTTPAATEKQTEAQTTKGSDEHEPVTLRFSWWGGDERRDATLAVIQQFEDKYPWITIEAEYGSSDGYNDKLATSLSANTAADIVQIDPAYMTGYVEGHDYFVDYREYGFNLSKFDEAYIGTTMNGGFDGKQWGLPTGVTGTAFMYNKELVDKIGIKLNLDGNYTWDEFIEQGKKVKEYDPSLTMFGTNITYLARIVLFDILRKQLGTNLYNKNTSPVTMNVTKEQIQNGLETIKEMFDNNIVPAASYMASYSGDTLQNDLLHRLFFACRRHDRSLPGYRLG